MTRREKIQSAVELYNEWLHQTDNTSYFEDWLMDKIEKEPDDESDTLWD